MPEPINQNRRRFLRRTALTQAAAPLSRIRNRASPRFRRFSLGYAEAGPANGPAVVLLHEWPYDIYSFVDVAPLLASVGYRVIVPYMRGCGTTRFLSDGTFRNGQPAAAANDVIDLMGALGIQKAVIAGFDWGGRSTDIVAAPWPERCYQ
jgi:pimeloyl-ACP methyl ester carboxylesterase